MRFGWSWAGQSLFKTTYPRKHVHVLCTVRGEIRKRQVHLYMEHVQNMFLAVPRDDQNFLRFIFLSKKYIRKSKEYETNSCKKVLFVIFTLNVERSLLQ